MVNFNDATAYDCNRIPQYFPGRQLYYLNIFLDFTNFRWSLLTYSQALIQYRFLSLLVQVFLNKREVHYIFELLIEHLKAFSNLLI